MERWKVDWEGRLIGRSVRSCGCGVWVLAVLGGVRCKRVPLLGPVNPKSMLLEFECF